MMKKLLIAMLFVTCASHARHFRFKLEDSVGLWATRHGEGYAVEGQLYLKVKGENNNIKIFFTLDPENGYLDLGFITMDDNEIDESIVQVHVKHKEVKEHGQNCYINVIDFEADIPCLKSFKVILMTKSGIKHTAKKSNWDDSWACGPSCLKIHFVAESNNLEIRPLPYQIDACNCKDLELNSVRE